MKMLGYSERGLVNALLYEIGTNPEAESLMIKFLNLVQYPDKQKCTPPENPRIETVMIEQSFSDFGDADAVLLGNDGGKKVAFFFEAKVKSSQRKEWTLQKEWADFEKRHSSSNLFSQLYFKLRMVNELKPSSEDERVEGPKDGIHFSFLPTRVVRSIGKNKVVHKAARKVIDHRNECYFIAMIPVRPADAKVFFEELLGKKPENYAGWDSSRYGYVCWEHIEVFCKNNKLVRTMEIFEFNKGQIYE
jgi:hypothetical protein